MCSFPLLQEPLCGHLWTPGAPRTPRGHEEGGFRKARRPPPAGRSRDCGRRPDRGPSEPPLKEAEGLECSGVSGPRAGEQRPPHPCPRGPALWVLPVQGEGLSGAAKNRSQQATAEGRVPSQGPGLLPEQGGPGRSLPCLGWAFIP